MKFYDIEKKEKKFLRRGIGGDPLDEYIIKSIWNSKY